MDASFLLQLSLHPLLLFSWLQFRKMTICPIASNCLEFSLATGQLYLLHAISRRRTFSFGSNFFSARTTWAIIFYDNSYTIYRPLHTIHNSFVTMRKRNKNSFQIVYNFSFCKIAFGCSVCVRVCLHEGDEKYVVDNARQKKTTVLPFITYYSCSHIQIQNISFRIFFFLNTVCLRACVYVYALNGKWQNYD